MFLATVYSWRRGRKEKREKNNWSLKSMLLFFWGGVDKQRVTPEFDLKECCGLTVIVLGYLRSRTPWSPVTLGSRMEVSPRSGHACPLTSRGRAVLTRPHQGSQWGRLRVCSRLLRSEKAERGAVRALYASRPFPRHVGSPK